MDYYYGQIPLHEARAAYPIAQLHADLLDFVKPRYLDPDPNPSKEPARRVKPWQATEVLPWYAYFDKPDPMPQTAATALLRHAGALPEWARTLAPLSEAQAVLAAPG